MQTVTPSSPELNHKQLKALAKATRPWWKRKRFWVAGFVVLLIGAAAAGSGSSDTSSTDVGVESAATETPADAAAADPEAFGPRSLSTNDDHPPAADVTVTKCGADEFGYMEAEVAVTNHSSKPSNYLIQVAFESENGSTQLATGHVAVNGLEPGQNAVETAGAFEKAEGGFTCSVDEVDRFAA